MDIVGFNIPTPSIHLTGFFSSTWLYVFIIGAIGLIAVAGIAIFLFFMTYSRKIVLFENVSGLGYQPTLRTRARVVKLGIGGEELLKTLAGGQYVSAYGRKMGKNSYWFAKGSDGYWYNIVLGDLDTKMAMLDINPIDRDVRMLHVALNRLAQQDYGKMGFLEKYGVHMMLFLFLIVLIAGMWFIIGKVGDATQALASTAQTNREVLDNLKNILNAQNNIVNGATQGTGIVPAT